MRSVVIVGAGGFGRQVLEIFKDHNRMQVTWNILGLVDEAKHLHGRVLNGYPVIGGLEWLREHNDESLACVVAVGACETRKHLASGLKEMGVGFCNAIHPSVIIPDSAEIGHDVIIFPYSVLSPDVKIGDHVHINKTCSIGHDAIIGSYCTIGPLVAITGADRLGEGVYVGAGATLIQGVAVGSWSTIGAGAVVINDIPDRTVAVGVPATIVRKRG